MARSPALPRRRRSGIATVVALLVVAAAALSATAAIQIYVGRERHSVFGDVAAAAANLRRDTWAGVGVAVAGIALAAVGVILLLAAIVPPRRELVRLADPDPDTLAGISPRGLRRDLASVASAVDGVTSARVHLRPRSVRVVARSAIRDRTGLSDAVRVAVDTRIAALSPHRPLRLSTRIVGKED